MKVLLIEDDKELSEILINQIKELNYEVEAFGSLESFLEYFKENPNLDYDLLLVDYNLPGEKGTEVFSYLERDGAVPNSVVITGEPFIENFSTRFDNVYTIQKPFDLKQVISFFKNQ